MTRPRHYVFAGGGSGGHLTPALAVAEEILSDDPASRITFLTSGRTIDAKVMRDASVVRDKRCTVIAMPVTGTPSLSVSGLKHSVELWRSFRTCCRWMKQHPADVVFATGAFASVPGLLAAHWLKIRTVLFEANATPGRVNRWWSARAAVRLCGCPGTMDQPVENFEFVGMPLRTEARTNGGEKGFVPKTLLIVGGSQGSERLNELIRLSLLSSEIPNDWQVLHQTGDQRALDRKAARYKPISFMPCLFAFLGNATLTVSRAGAVTLAELAATGCPAILVPMSNSAESHQITNAQRLVDCGAALMIDETVPNAAIALGESIKELMADEARRNSMSTAMRRLHHDGAARTIAVRLRQLAQSG